MTTMPNPARLVERSVAVCQRYGMCKQHAYETVAQIAMSAHAEIIESTDTDPGWLIRVANLAIQRAATCAPSCPPHASQPLPSCCVSGAPRPPQ